MQTCHRNRPSSVPGRSGATRRRVAPVVVAVVSLVTQVPSAPAGAASLSPEEPATVATVLATTVSAPAGFGAPGPLAVSEGGILYVASDLELYKLNGRRLEAIARAPQEILSAVAVANGTMYLGEADALQAVSPIGVVYDG